MHMPLIWKDEYNLGIHSIDVQHRALIDIINACAGEAECELSPTRTGDMLARIDRHAREHFAYEEEFFVKYNYSDALSHHREHEAFLDKITEFRQRIDAGEAVAFTDILEYLEQWFLHHVLVIDKRYVDLFLAEGVE